VATKRTTRLGLTPQGTISILAVASVVVLVSLPLLRRMAMMENQRDALAVLRALGDVVEAAPPGAPAIGALPLDAPALATRSLEPVAGGLFLRARGYYFDLVTDGGEPTLRAWPCEYGRTGFRSFVRTSGGALLDHDNAEAAFSGARAPRGPWRLDAGWRELPQDADYP